MTDNAKVLKVFSWLNISGTALGSTLLMTTENGNQNFYVTGIDIESSAATAITIAGSASIGTNSPNYNNIVPITALTNLISSGIKTMLTPTQGAIVVPPNTGIYLKLTTAAVGTSQLLNAHVIGFYGL